MKIKKKKKTIYGLTRWSLHQKKIIDSDIYIVGPPKILERMRRNQTKHSKQTAINSFWRKKKLYLNDYFVRDMRQNLPNSIYHVTYLWGIFMYRGWSASKPQSCCVPVESERRGWGWGYRGRGRGMVSRPQVPSSSTIKGTLPVSFPNRSQLPHHQLDSTKSNWSNWTWRSSTIHSGIWPRRRPARL